jgi:hypothetical protein
LATTLTYLNGSHVLRSTTSDFSCALWPVPYQFAVDEETDTVTFVSLFAEVKFAVTDSRDEWIADVLLRAVLPALFCLSHGMLLMRSAVTDMTSAFAPSITHSTWCWV